MERDMFLQRALRISFMLVFVGGLVSLSLGVASTARSQSAQETAIGPDARAALARMGETLSAKQFSFQSRTFRSYAGPNGELLHIAHTTKTIYSRPDRLAVSVTGDDGSIKVLYDGKTLVLYAVEAKQYVSLPVSGGIEKALDVLEERTGTDYPLADLLSDNPEKAVASGITSGGKVGTSTIDGVRCNHFFFEQAADDLTSVSAVTSKKLKQNKATRFMTNHLLSVDGVFDRALADQQRDQFAA